MYIHGCIFTYLYIYIYQQPLYHLCLYIYMLVSIYTQIYIYIYIYIYFFYRTYTHCVCIIRFICFASFDACLPVFAITLVLYKGMLYQKVSLLLCFTCQSLHRLHHGKLWREFDMTKADVTQRSARRCSGSQKGSLVKADVTQRSARRCSGSQ